jgi:hypothetical protein
MKPLKPKPEQLHCPRPVKQKRALLKSNPPRDNWIEGDEIKSVSICWGGQNLPNNNLETIISEPSHALKNLGLGAGAPRSVNPKAVKTSLSDCPFFRSKPIGLHACERPVEPRH